ncbi:50S ribosomal protein L30e [Candidatus Micrarchaeota archaeon CG10_big_fil_rev_8_21_14_0_10_45_29]|nr:MAG: 50S ribosomal protein L30e [Candidatus Micrarchaeota archaeon CG10_big_fil_rev_8_21_14_0_10_45_29]
MAKKKTESEETTDLGKAIRMCADSGKVEFGTKISLKRAMHGQGKLIVSSSNAPKEESEDMAKFCKMSKLPIIKFNGTSRELGAICGKAFPVTFLWVSAVGDSPIMDFAK